MESLKPWMYAPLELIKHGEEHQQANEDFDKHIAIISYDNAIELSINTYLQLHPSQREEKAYMKEQVSKRRTNYHTLLDFFFDEFLKTSNEIPPIAKNIVIHYHTLRNELYHDGKNLVPSEHDIQGIHEAALYIFSMLFKINGEMLLKSLPVQHTQPTTKLHFQGNGKNIFKMSLKVGAAIFHIIYKGKNRHACLLYTEENIFMGSLLEKFYEGGHTQTVSIKKYVKSRNIKNKGTYLLEVSAESGTWDIEIEQ